MVDVCVVGHVVRDVNTIGGSEYEPRPGGTAFYSAMVYNSLGLRTAVVTKVAADSDGSLLGELRKHGIEVFNLRTETTTTFRNYYALDNSDIRMQRVSSQAGTIRLEEMPGIGARIHHIGPLTKEDIDPSIIRRCAETGGVVVLDAQGFTRDIVGGKVVAGAGAGCGDFLKYVDILQADSEEILILSGESTIRDAVGRIKHEGVDEVIVTKASHGSTIFGCSRTIDIEAVPPRRKVDATGCGDTYLAAYVTRRMLTDDLGDCGNFASVAASLNIENLGPFAGTEEDVLERLSMFERDAPTPRRVPEGSGVQTDDDGAEKAELPKDQDSTH